MAHGFGVQTTLMQVRLPPDNLQKARSELSSLLYQIKGTLHHLQFIIGFLNLVQLVGLFCFINLTRSLTRPFHHVRITSQVRQDLKVWLVTLKSHNGISAIQHQVWVSSQEINLYTDAAKSLGYAAVVGNKGIAAQWESDVSAYSIAVLELYPIVLALFIRGAQLQNHCILFLCDEQTIVSR